MIIRMQTAVVVVIYIIIAMSSNIVLGSNQCNDALKRLCNIVFLLCEEEVHHPSTNKCGKQEKKRTVYEVKGRRVNDIMQRLLTKHSKVITGLPMLEDESNYPVCQWFKAKLEKYDTDLPKIRKRKRNNNEAAAAIADARRGSRHS